MADIVTRLWPDTSEYFFRDRSFLPREQCGLTCVATCLAILSGANPSDFDGKINTQDPVSWSDALLPFGMKLAYVPTDVRKLRFYIEELVRYDDLFLLGFYLPREPAALLRDPQEDGWLCGSHLVVLHRDRIVDPMEGTSVGAVGYCGLEYHTKRVFRVVPVGHRRGL
jgi:hypothetical protein